MKRFFLALAALAMLFTSCSKDDTGVATGDNGLNAKVNFSLSLQNAPALRTISDGSGANTLVYAIFNEAGNIVVNKKTVATTFPATVEATLVKDQVYTIAVWAQDSDCNAYTVSDDMKVTIDYAGLNNDETRDAFYAAKEFKVSGDMNVPVTMKRPFAQINVGVTAEDWNKAAALGVTVAQSQVELNNVPNTLNIYTGEATGATAVTYGSANIPTELLQVDTDNDGVKEDYKYLSMSYVLANSEPTALNALKFTFTTSASPIVLENGLAGVNIQRNWRTNIVGRILTGNVDFNITIDEEYNKNAHNYYPDAVEIIPGAVKYDAGSKTYLLSTYEGMKWYADQSNATNMRAASGTTLHETVKYSVDKNGKYTLFSGQNVVLDTDVDMAGKVWTPIGKNNIIAGTFDGGDHLISNVTITGTDKRVGLFASSGHGMTIKNIRMKNVNISGSDYVGAIVGYGLCARIENCHVDGGTVTATVLDKDGGAKVGGIVGYLTAQNVASLKNASVKNLTVTAYRDVAAVVGMAQNAGCVIDGISAENVSVIANRLQEYKEATSTNAGSIVGRSSGNPAPANVTEKDVIVSVLEFDTNGNMPVSSVAQLKAIGDAVANGNTMEGKTLTLTNDIDYAQQTIAPIGYNPATGVASVFKGTFDGNGKTIKNLHQSDLAGGYTQSVGLFAKVEDATIKNVVIEDIVAAKYGAEAGAIASIAIGDCTFEDIEVKSGSIVAYNNDAAAIVGWGNVGNFTFKDITIGSDVTVFSLWNSYDTSVGGVVGTLKSGSTATFENITVACKLDVYNDVCSNYQWGAYRRTGMLIGNMNETQTINGTTYPDPAAAGVTCNNVTVIYGDWMNYHYCEFKSNGHGSYDDEFTWKCSRVEGSDWGSNTIDTEQCNHESFESHNRCIPVDQLFGGGQGVFGLASYPGVTVNYPASYNPGN